MGQAYNEAEALRDMHTGAEDRALRRYWFAGLAALLLLLIYSLIFGNSDRPVGMALSLAPVFGLPVFSLTSFIASRSRRRPTGVDAIRIGCWTVLACAEGVRQIALSYYRWYWPQYALAWTRGALAIEGLALLLILVVTLLYPSRKAPAEGECPSCGYDLRGSESGGCPECGLGMAATRSRSSR